MKKIFLALTLFLIPSVSYALSISCKYSRPENQKENEIVFFIGIALLFILFLYWIALTFFSKKFRIPSILKIVLFLCILIYFYFSISFLQSANAMMIDEGVLYPSHPCPSVFVKNVTEKILLLSGVLGIFSVIVFTQEYYSRIIFFFSKHRQYLLTFLISVIFLFIIGTLVYLFSLL